MSHPDPTSFDVDVDLAPLYGAKDPLVVSDRWYQLVQPRADRPPSLQRKIEESFRNVVLRAQWQAACRREERRRAVRVPLLSGVQVTTGPRLVSTDISLAGLRCSGRPTAGMLDIEFRLPGLAFPVAARAEVANFQDSPVIPLVGLRFVDIERTYVDHIERYIDERCREVRAA